MLDTLVYESRADARLTDAELEVILIGSRVRNGRRGITGALLKRDARILQLIEGPTAEIERTFAAIAASPLHHDVRVLRRETGLDRVFDRWHMGFYDFQTLHGRSDSTDAWLRALPALQVQASTNPVLAVLLERWNEVSNGAA
ncbi:BLUF domain-containing protein [Lysobacter claricitrinus]|uniref:BLUF domain-containing protein n=1 Tax=Lysobacter claricitrinus TaxID=3367728 RepID=UPI0038B328FB